MHLNNICKRILIIFSTDGIFHFIKHTGRQKTWYSPSVPLCLSESSSNADWGKWSAFLILRTLSWCSLSNKCIPICTYSANRSAALTNFRHVGVLTHFHRENLMSISYIHSICVWTESIILWGSESGARLGSRHPSRVSRATNAIAAKILEIWRSECRYEILILM
jgi:hypothetical protein